MGRYDYLVYNSIEEIFFLFKSDFFLKEVFFDEKDEDLVEIKEKFIIKMEFKFLLMLSYSDKDKDKMEFVLNVIFFVFFKND